MAEQVEIPRLHDRLVAAYTTAMAATHTGGRVELHLGEGVIEHLKSLCAAPSAPLTDINRAWGFPVRPVAFNPAHISVHVVTDIY